jgi:hypothetical protein
VYLVSLIVRDKMASLFISIILIIGTSVLTPLLKPLRNSAQFLPSTYLNAVSVVCGQSANKLNNWSVSFEDGVITLLVAIAVLFFLVMTVQHYSKR